ncbi:hypothetical protein Tco_1554327 [Tanacetum coccineum]
MLRSRLVNERQIQTTEEKTDTSNALDAGSVIIESNGTESKEQDTSSRSGNDAHADDNVSATGQQHTEQPEFNNEGKVDQNAEQCHDIRPLPAKLTDDKTTELSNQSLESENVCLKKTVAQCVENDDFKDEDNSTFLPKNESSILEPSSPRPPPEPPDVCLNFKPDNGPE